MGEPNWDAVHDAVLSESIQAYKSGLGEAERELLPIEWYLCKSRAEAHTSHLMLEYKRKRDNKVIGSLAVAAVAILLIV